jgi:hypothetical protein
MPQLQLLHVSAHLRPYEAHAHKEAVEADAPPAGPVDAAAAPVGQPSAPPAYVNMRQHDYSGSSKSSSRSSRLRTLSASCSTSSSAREKSGFFEPLPTSFCVSICTFLPASASVCVLLC